MKRVIYILVLLALPLCVACTTAKGSIQGEEPNDKKEVVVQETKSHVNQEFIEMFRRSLDETMLSLTLPKEVTPEIYRRFLVEGIDLTWNCGNMNVSVKDIDKNGIDDVFISLNPSYEEEVDKLYFEEPSIFIAMNDDEIWTYEYTEVSYWTSGWQGADIDQDGNMEIIFRANTGGLGGGSSWVMGVLKYQNNTLTEMKLPDDRDDGDFQYGIRVAVSLGQTRDVYTAYCPYLDQTILFDRVIKEGFTDEYDNYIKYPEMWWGGNIRGYDNFDIISRDGREYLVLDECLVGEGSTSNYLGIATFLLDWNEAGEPKILEFSIGSYEQMVYEELRR